jgi:hypothetical protein
MPDSPNRTLASLEKETHSGAEDEDPSKLKDAEDAIVEKGGKAERQGAAQAVRANLTLDTGETREKVRDHVWQLW